MPEVVVSCGGIRPAAAAAGGRQLALSTLAPEGSPERVKLNLGHLTKRMVADVPDRLADLLEIAADVSCADQFARRDTPEMQRMGAAWRRSFRFHVPVRDLATWQRPEVVEALAETLGFLSDDDYAFRFTPASDRSHGLQPLPRPAWRRRAGRIRSRPGGAVLGRARLLRGRERGLAEAGRARGAGLAPARNAWTVASACSRPGRIWSSPTSTPSTCSRRPASPGQT